MLLYNITYKVENRIAIEWVQWQKEIHIPEIINTTYFYAHYFYELPEQDDTEGKTFAIQFLAKTMEDYNKYILQFAKQFSMKERVRWGDAYIAFTTLMKKV